MFCKRVVVVLIAMCCHLPAERGGTNRSIVLETFTIEGKIKKPQVALISVDKRPQIRPMALASLESRKDITKNINGEMFEYKYYDSPFTMDVSLIK